MAPPFRQAEFDVIFNKGIFREGEIIDLGVQRNIVSASGSWLSYGETRLGQGREKAAEFLIANPDVADEIKKGILKAEEETRL